MLFQNDTIFASPFNQLGLLTLVHFHDIVLLTDSSNRKGVRAVSLSIIECLRPVTSTDIGSRIKVNLVDGESFSAVVDATFPLQLCVGFQLDITSTTPNLQNRLLRHFIHNSVIDTHVSAVSSVTNDIADNGIWQHLGFSSKSDLDEQLQAHYDHIRHENWVPVYVHGRYGMNVIAIGDDLDGRISMPAFVPPLQLGKVKSIDTSITD